jgi:hypothetical protein
MKHAVLTLAMLLCTLPTQAQTGEREDTMQSAAERLAERAPGRWQGDWRLTRVDPRIRTRAGALALRLQVIHDAGSPVIEVDWTADRAICEDPMAGPCEWVGQSGRQTGLLVANGWVMALPLSADNADPHWLRLTQDPSGAHGQLIYNFGSAHMPVELRPEDPAPR